MEKKYKQAISVGWHVFILFHETICFFLFQRIDWKDISSRTTTKTIKKKEYIVKKIYTF